MKLPDYFLADLPGEAEISGSLIAEACQTLKRNRERFLLWRSTASLIDAIATVAADWLSPQSPYRRAALEEGPAATGFSRQTLESGLDALFGSITTESLQCLVMQDLGNLDRLERLTAEEYEPGSGRLAVARGPEFLVHITAGRIPNPPVMSIVLGLLARSAQFVKCASGTSFLPRLFGHSLREVEPKLGACLEIAEWKGGNEALEGPLFAEADCLTAMGDDSTLAAIRPRLPAKVRFLGYGSRVSFGYVAREVLEHHSVSKAVAAAARDVAAWDQLGCLSPHLFYVETGGRHSPERFAEQLGAELDRIESRQPRGVLPVDTAAAIATRRAFYEVRAAFSDNTKMWNSQNSTSWTVVYENDPRFQLSCLHRFVYVKAVQSVEQALQGADSVRGRVATVGLAAPGTREQSIAHQLAAWGVPRICSLGHMQSPPAAWRHDGRPSLGDMVVWTDWERSQRTPIL